MSAPRPPFPYFGGKQNTADQIVALMPEHRHYVEPFCGGLSVLMAKPRSPMETVNDLDGALMTFWRVLRERPEELARVCALTPHARGELALAREMDGLPDLEVARRVWVALSQGRGARLTRTGWKYFVDAEARHDFGMPDYLDAYVSRIQPAAARIHGVSLECRPALDVIAQYGAAAQTLLYVDPPYLGSTRHASPAYRNEMQAIAAHEQLAEALHRANAAVVLSGYASKLYDTLYAGWFRHEISSRSLLSSIPRARGGSRTEVIWSNRPLNRQATLEEAIA